MYAGSKTFPAAAPGGNKVARDPTDPILDTASLNAQGRSRGLRHVSGGGQNDEISYSFR